MSDLEEPPAKVLKIDNIDGITHVTELSGFPEPFDGVPGEVLMGEESGVIEGGAEPEQEEWLSEGILTDDDYNPASQETVDNHTDSQLGTGDEEHLDSTLDSEANVADSETNLADSEANLADSETNLADSETNLADSEANLADSETNLADSETNLADSETNLADSETNIADSEANLADSEAHLTNVEAEFAESVAHVAASEVNLADSEAHLVASEAHTAENETNLVETEANGADIAAHLAHSEEIAENEVNAAEIEDMECEANISLENGVPTESEADLTMCETSMTQDANVTNSEPNMSQSVENLMEMSNIDSNIMESQTYTQEYTKLDTFEENVINNADVINNANVINNTNVINNLKSENDTDVIIQRVITLNKNPNVKEIEAKTVELNIEETMKHLDGKKDDLRTDDFERFLKKSTVVKTEVKPRSEASQDDGNDQDDENAQDDGNDTDDLLRMLGEGDSKGKKKLTKTAKDIRATDGGASSDEDDNFVYEGSSASMKSLKAAKEALAKRQPIKAEPEDMDGDDETEMSADETKTMQRMFSYGSKSIVSRPVRARLHGTKASPPHAAVKRTPPILNVIERPLDGKPARQYQNKRLVQSRAQSILKPTTHSPRSVAPTKTSFTSTQSRTPHKAPEVKTPVPFKPAALQAIDKTKANKFEPGKKLEPGRIVQPGRSFQPGKMVQPGKRIEAGKVKVGSGNIKIEPEEMMDEEEFLDDDEFGLDEDEFAESDVETSHNRQRIMRPEMMDEEVPSDGESGTEDGSLYDELPSSDSDDMDDWFTLDVRSEKAGDYIPLLGPQAKELLLEEKRRVSARLTTLKQSHTALITSGKQQAATLRRATAALAELDDMLRAA